MLRSHLNAVEGQLLASAQISANSGHSVHKGTPREAFVRDFLEKHMGERVAIGTGEVIDCNSQPGDKRNQFDVVVYKRDFPKLEYGGGIHAFLAESVVATISVKSTLTKDEFCDDMHAAQATKRLQRNILTSRTAGYIPPSILSYVVAYDGPAHMETIHGWISELQTEIPYPTLPINGDDRVKVIAPALDAIFVLGKGFLHYGNAQLSFLSSEALNQNPNSRWAIGEAERGSLLIFFAFLLQAISGALALVIEPHPYLRGFQLGPGKLKIRT